MFHLKWVINYNRQAFHQDLGLMYKLNLSFMHSLEVFRRKSGLEVASMEFLHFVLDLDILEIFILQNKFALSLKSFNSTHFHQFNYLTYHNLKSSKFLLSIAK